MGESLIRVIRYYAVPFAGGAGFTVNARAHIDLMTGARDILYENETHVVIEMTILQRLEKPSKLT